MVLLTADPTAADPVAAKRAEIRRYFHQTCAIYERLFDLIRDDASYYERHEPLRHPLIFYFAHPAVFYVNKLTAGRLIPRRLDPVLEAMMAVGVDEMSWDDLNTAHYEWPSVRTVRDYRAALRELVDEFIQSMPLELPIRQDSPAWVILMGIEHERIHLETSSVIMRQMPLDELRHGDELSAEERRLWAACPTTATPPANDWLPVAGRTVRLGKHCDDHTYGWDNEYGVEEVALPPFRAGRRLVSNAESCSTSGRCRSTGPSRSTAWRRRPTAPGWRGRRVRTCCCRPRPTGRRFARWCPATSPRGIPRPATSTSGTSRRVAPSTPSRKATSATWSATSGSGPGRRSCRSRGSRYIHSTTTSPCRPSTAATI